MSYTVKDFLKTPLFVRVMGLGTPHHHSLPPTWKLSSSPPPHKAAALLFFFPHCQILFLSGALHVYSNVNQVNFSSLFHSSAWCPRSTPKCLIKKNAQDQTKVSFSFRKEEDYKYTFIFNIFLLLQSWTHLVTMSPVSLAKLLVNLLNRISQRAEL